jgi:hypothetical protein
VEQLHFALAAARRRAAALFEPLPLPSALIGGIRMPASIFLRAASTVSSSLIWKREFEEPILEAAGGCEGRGAESTDVR